MRKVRPGFAFAEWICILAIIVILSLILWPVVERALDAARTPPAATTPAVP